VTRFIPEHTIEEIRDSIDIVAVIRDFVALTQRGRNFVGLCPFHSEDTPSFTVSPEKQMWHCFGCGEGGNAYTFLMKHENITFPEAVERLADQAGVTLPEQEEPDPEENRRHSLRQRIYEINRIAARWFYRNLRELPIAENARRYLDKRGLSRKVQDSFGLGYAPDGWEGLLKHLKEKGFEVEDIFQAGLISERKGQSGHYDRFRSRIIFPILDAQGRVTAFGGRITGEGEPKYLNSPETPVFHKGRMLYGLNWAAKTIRAEDRVVIVEGYMDVIAAHQFGAFNTVASLGTAFTPEQGKLLMRFSKNISIAYDSDTAGAKATMRGLDILQSLGAKVRVGQLPEGMDPDDYLRRKGIDEFQRLVATEALSLIEYKLALAMKEYDIGSIEGRVAIVNFLVPDLARLKSAVEREEYIRLVAERLDLSPEAVQTEIRLHSRNSENNRVKKDKIGKNRHNDSLVRYNAETPRVGMERQLLQHILRDARQAQIVSKVIMPETLSDGGVREVLNLLTKIDYADGVQPAVLMDKLSEAGQKTLSHVMVSDEKRLDKFEHLLEKLNLFQVDRMLEELEQGLKDIEKQGGFMDIQKFLVKSFVLLQENDILRRINIKRH